MPLVRRHRRTNTDSIFHRIIVGVKYCFRYNQRNRARALGENGEPIDLAAMPRPHRRRREKKLMSMEEVNERFPLTKYKTWRSTREAEGLPAAGGVTAPPSRAGSLKNEEGTIDGERGSKESTRPDTAATTVGEGAGSPEVTEGAARPETSATSETAAANTEKPEERRDDTNLNRNASVATVDEDEDEDDPIRTAAPPEMLAVPGDTCAICLDTLEDDDDVRGLTCGHAFHAACVDPWLTSRRACCPLCKADYYIPKPRADGSGSEDATNANTGRRNGSRMNMPQNPPPVWIGTRAGMAFRPRMIFAGPRIFVGGGGAENSAHSVYNASPRRQERRRREQEVAGQNPNAQQAEVQPEGASGWRSRLPAMPNVRLPGLGRRNQGEQAQSGTNATPGELEAQTRTNVG